MFNDIDSESLLLVGRVWRAHGVRGELKVVPETDDADRFKDLDLVFTGKNANSVEPRNVASVRFQPSKRGTVVVLKLEGIDAREDADRLRSTSIFARAGDLPPLADDGFFVHNLVGMRVTTEDDEEVGTVEDILDLPAHEVLVVAREGRENAMIPVVPEFIVDIDLDDERVVIRPIEGLL